VSPIIDHKAFAFDEADGKRDFDDALEHVAQNVASIEGRPVRLQKAVISRWKHASAS